MIPISIDALWPVSADESRNEAGIMGSLFCSTCGREFQLSVSGCEKCPHCGKGDCEDA